MSTELKAARDAYHSMRRSAMNEIAEALKATGFEPYGRRFLHQGRRDYRSHGSLARPHNLSNYLWITAYDPRTATSVLVYASLEDLDVASNNVHILTDRLAIQTFENDYSRHILDPNNRHLVDDILVSCGAARTGDPAYLRALDSGLDLADKGLPAKVLKAIQRKRN